MTEDRNLRAGDVVVVSFPRHTPSGREQEGRRPAVILAVPTGKLRFPVVILVPLTTQEGAWVGENPTVYPTIRRGAGGLPLPSVVLLDQIRSVDARRIGGYLGCLSGQDFSPITSGVRGLIGQSSNDEPSR
ncbi:type II toxin-antitoxin system PemK/MazF family toxin [bacterium]|nr:type II toxin-antitoxin system PemK/MazF family toxin [bacterium]